MDLRLWLATSNGGDTHPSVNRGSARHKRRFGLVALLAFGLYGCTGGLSCGGDSGGCINAYPYPQSDLPNGVATVDDGARMRMTQAGLDFLQAHMKDILIGAFAADANEPNTIIIQFWDPIEVGGGIRLAHGADEGSCSNDAQCGLNRQCISGQCREVYPTTIKIPAEDLANQLQFNFVEGTTDGLHARVEGLVIGLDARAFGEWSFAGTNPTAACDIDGTQNICPPSSPNCQAVSTVTFDVRIYPDVGQGAQCDLGSGECFLIDVTVQQLTLADIDNDSIEISKPPRCNVPSPSPLCSPECSDTVVFVDSNGDAECSAMCGASDWIAGFALGLGGAILPYLESFMTDMVENAMRDALADFDGAPISIASKIDLAETSPDLINPTAHSLGYLMGPTGDAFDVNCPTGVNCAATKGMDLNVRTGFEAAPPDAAEADPIDVPHPCVLPLTGSAFASHYDGNGEFIAPDAQPLTGEYEGTPYHLGMSLARSAVNQALFGTYNAGVLCIQLDSEQVHVLANGAFPLSAGTLDLLTEGQLRQFASPTAPALITIVPSKPPKITLGAGDDTEGHLIADWDDVEISFYVLVYERFSRVFAVDVDISASMTVFVDPEDQTLRVAISDGPTIDGFSPTYNELLPNVEFDEVLESLVSLAFDSLLGDDLGFGYDISGALATALGVPLYVDFRGLETVPTAGSREFLNAYLSLTDTPPSPRMPVLPSALRFADEPGVFVRADAEDLHPTTPSGEVQLLGLSQALSPEHEVFAQVDFGTWRGPFRPSADGVLTVRDAKLALVGEHVLRFRVRHEASLTSLMDIEGEMRLWVDPRAPWAELLVDGDSLVASGQDVGTRPEDLVFSWRFDDGAWSEPGTQRRFALEDAGDVRRASVRAHDLAGNVSRPVSLDLATARIVRERRLDTVATPGGVAPPYGCATTSGAPSALAVFALLLGAAGLVRRRHRRA